MSDCFHDGEKTLPMVYEMHDELAQYFRHCDHITGEALRLMINEMLDKEDGRPLARQLYLKSERIFSHAETMLRNLQLSVTQVRRVLQGPLNIPWMTARKRLLKHPEIYSTINP